MRQKTPPTDRLFRAPSARSAGPTDRPPRPARVGRGSLAQCWSSADESGSNFDRKWCQMRPFALSEAPVALGGSKRTDDGSGVPGKAAVMTVTHVTDRYACARSEGPSTTCTRLLFGTATNDLTGGARRGKGAMVISDTLALSSKRDRQGGGAAHSPTAAAELPVAVAAACRGGRLPAPSGARLLLGRPPQPC